MGGVERADQALLKEIQESQRRWDESKAEWQENQRRWEQNQQEIRSMLARLERIETRYDSTLGALGRGGGFILSNLFAVPCKPS